MQAPQSEGMVLGGGATRALSLEGQWGLITGAPRDQGTQRSTPADVHKVLSTPGTRAKAVTSQESGLDLPAGFGGSPGVSGWEWWEKGGWAAVEKRKRAQINKIRNEKREATIDTTEI